MSGFYRQLGRDLRALPANLRQGLRPGRAPGEAPKKRLRRAFLYHLHPLSMSQRALSPTTTLGLGIASVTLLFLLTASGLLLMIYYAPAPDRAHGSLLDLQYAVTFGSFLRSLHRYSTYGLLLTVGAHLLRIVAQAAYHRRELNWLLGLSLGLGTLLLAFTGYLLPWDQRSVWATVVATELLEQLPVLGASLSRLLLGGASLGDASLLRFYTLHVAVLPALLLGGLALHLWRVRKDGGLAVGDPRQRGSLLPTWPHGIHREAILALGVATVLVLVSTLWPAGLGAVADLHHPENPEKAPWFFVGLQEMVSYSALVGGGIFPLVLAGLLLLLPFLDRESTGVGRWLGDRAQGLWLAGTAGLAAAFFLALVRARLQVESAQLPSTDGVNPAAGMLLLAALAFFGVGTFSGDARLAGRVALRAALLVLVLALLGFTLMGLMRGPDWVLLLPGGGLDAP